MTELITIEELEKEIKTKEGEIKEIELSIDGLEVIKDNTIIVNTLQVAEIFEKNHYDVTKKVKAIIKKHPELLNDGTFTLVEYVDKKGEKRPMYEMGREGFAILANKFTGDKALDFTIKYVRAFNKMVDLLSDITLLTSKREQLLIEEEKHYLYSNDYKDYCIINNICGFSTNYLFEPVINWNNPSKPKMVKTQAYSLWSKQFKEKTHDKLIDYVKENNIDLTKNIYITFVMKYPEKLDLVNLEKGLIDQITLILQDLQPNFDDVQVKALYMRTGGGGSAKDYNDSIIAIRIQN